MAKKSTGKKAIDDQITPPQHNNEHTEKTKKVAQQEAPTNTSDITEAFASEISHSQKRSKLVALGVVLLILVVAGLWFFLGQTSSPEEQEAEALEKALGAVSERLLLPADAEAYLANITDAETLMKEQPFFTGSVDGDQLLLFPQLRRAVIWSPSREIIVNVGPIQDGVQNNNQSAQPAAASDEVAATSTEEEISVEVRNGTNKAGHASDVANEVIALGGYEVTAATDASVKGYEETVIFVNNAAAKTAAERLANTLDATVVDELPQGEVATEAAILVVLGADA